MTMEKSIKPVSISKKDILWSYLSQFLSIGAGILILPAILHKLSSQEIGINYILLSISAFIPLLDAGFSPQFRAPVTIRWYILHVYRNRPFCYGEQHDVDLDSFLPVCFLYDLSLILSFVTDWQRIYQRVSEIVCAQ